MREKGSELQQHRVVVRNTKYGGSSKTADIEGHDDQMTQCTEKPDGWRDSSRGAQESRQVRHRVGRR